MNSILNNINKILLFGILGAVGGLVAAVVGESLIGFPSDSKSRVKPQVDLLFVLDISNSMTLAIEGIKSGIGDFVSGLCPESTDFRIGLITFADATASSNPNEAPRPLMFGPNAFTSNVEAFKSEMFKVVLLNGIDDPEQSFAALSLASQQNFRPSSSKVLVLITDQISRPPDSENPSLEAVSKTLLKNGISQLHLVVPASLFPLYGNLQVGGIKGNQFPLVAGSQKDFNSILPKISNSVVSMLSNGGAGCSPAGLSGKVLFASGLWTALLSVGVLLALLFGQNTYVKNQVKIRSFIFGSVVSFTLGVLAGVIGEVFFGTVTGLVVSNLVGRVLTWSLFGALLGGAIAIFVPNLKLIKAGIGGGLGGAIGAVGFAMASEIFSDLSGRLLGAAVIGFFIGIMIVFADLLLREAWLEIKYGPNDRRTLTLGSEPISIGSAPELCTLLINGIRPIEMRISLQPSGICAEVFNSQTNKFESPRPVQPGMAWSFGSAAVSVHGNK